MTVDRNFRNCQRKFVYDNSVTIINCVNFVFYCFFLPDFASILIRRNSLPTFLQSYLLIPYIIKVKLRNTELRLWNIFFANVAFNWRMTYIKVLPNIIDCHLRIRLHIATSIIIVVCWKLEPLIKCGDHTITEWNSKIWCASMRVICLLSIIIF